MFVVEVENFKDLCTKYEHQTNTICRLIASEYQLQLTCVRNQEVCQRLRLPLTHLATLHFSVGTHSYTGQHTSSPSKMRVSSSPQVGFTAQVVEE